MPRRWCAPWPSGPCASSTGDGIGEGLRHRHLAREGRQRRARRVASGTRVMSQPVLLRARLQRAARRAPPRRARLAASPARRARRKAPRQSPRSATTASCSTAQRRVPAWPQRWRRRHARPRLGAARCRTAIPVLRHHAARPRAGAVAEMDRLPLDRRRLWRQPAAPGSTRRRRPQADLRRADAGASPPRREWLAFGDRQRTCT